MTRLLVLGNSHAAAFKHAWDSIETDFPKVETSFFVLPGSEFDELRLDSALRAFGAIDENAVSADTCARLKKFYGDTTISLDPFNHVLVVGAQHGMLELLSILSGNDIDGLRETGAGQTLSGAAFDFFRRDLTRLYQPDAEWVDLQDIDVTFHAMPRFSERAATAPKSFVWEHRVAGPLVRQDDGVSQALESLATDHADLLASQRIAFRQQPLETLTSGGFTRAEFSDNARGILGNGLPSDYLHMNTEYGIACLTAYLTDKVCT